jgi:hypothetical protein
MGSVSGAEIEILGTKRDYVQPENKNKSEAFNTMFSTTGPLSSGSTGGTNKPYDSSSMPGSSFGDRALDSGRVNTNDEAIAAESEDGHGRAGGGGGGVRDLANVDIEHVGGGSFNVDANRAQNEFSDYVETTETIVPEDTLLPYDFIYIYFF